MRFSIFATRPARPRVPARRAGMIAIVSIANWHGCVAIEPD